MTQSERQKRIIARGEFSDHCHVITGDVIIETKNGKTLITVTEDSNACLRHLVESEWIKGNEVWTGEHKDIKVRPGTYEYVPQMVFDPISKRIENAID